MVRHWCEAMGDTNPIYLDQASAEASVHGGLVAPPTMLQAWVMRPFGAPRDESDSNPYAQLTKALESRGYTSVVATNCEQTYDRYLRPGDRLTMRTVIDAVSGEKTTGLGTGHFITTRQDYYDQAGARVGSMLFRILKFRQAPKKQEAAPKSRRPRPSPMADQAFWFEGLLEGKLLIQRCSDCGEYATPRDRCVATAGHSPGTRSKPVVGPTRSCAPVNPIQHRGACLRNQPDPSASHQLRPRALDRTPGQGQKAACNPALGANRLGASAMVQRARRRITGDRFPKRSWPAPFSS